MAIKVELPSEYLNMFLVHEVDTGMRRAMEKELRPLGITPIAAGLIYILQTADEPVKLKDLSQWLFRKPHTISELVTRMAGQDLVKKIKGKQKKGTIRVAITKKGSDILNKYMSEMKVVHKIMSVFTEEETKTFVDCMEKLRNRIFEVLAAGTIEDHSY